MINFKQFLSEAKHFNLAKKAYANLSYEAQRAIDDWESHNWIGGPLEEAFKKKSPVYKEIEAAFAPVRATLGSSVRLYRGVSGAPNDKAKTRVLESWTDSKPVAEYFAGLRTQQTKAGRQKVTPVATDAELERLYKQYLAKGYLKYGGYIYKRNDKHPELRKPDYYDIFNRHRSYVTDGDNLLRSLKRDRDYQIEYNNKILKDTQVLERVIPSKNIIWITNNLNSKEFIVAV